MPKLNLESWTTEELLLLDGMEDTLAEADLDPAEMGEDELRATVLDFCRELAERKARAQGELEDEDEFWGEDGGEDADDGDLI